MTITVVVIVVVVVVVVVVLCVFPSWSFRVLSDGGGFPSLDIHVLIHSFLSWSLTVHTTTVISLT